jgi:hypothetical protein
VSLDEVVDKSPIYLVDYTLHPDRMLRFGESQMVGKHLARLVESGLVEADGQGAPARLFRKSP